MKDWDARRGPIYGGEPPRKGGMDIFEEKKEQMREQRNTLQSNIILTYKYKIYHRTHSWKLSIIELLVHSLLFIS